MINKILKSGFIAMSFGMALSAHGAILVQYDFTDGSLAVSSGDPNLAGSDVGASFTGGGLTPPRWGGSTAGNLFVRADVTGLNALDTGRYFEFTVSPLAAHELDLSSLDFEIQAQIASGGVSPYTTNVNVRSSLDSYAADLSIGPFSAATSGVPSASAWVPVSIDLSGAVFQDLAAALTFRIYVWDNQTGMNDITRIDTLVLNGTAVAVPEPEAYGMLGCGVALLAAFRRLRKALS